jgi:DNA excision repair protein ERCC-2
MNKIKLSVRELVGYAHMSGDIGADSISLERALEGTRIHKLIQNQMGDEYKREYHLKHEFNYNDIDFEIEGRADGIITNENGVVVDEIKSTYKPIDTINEFNYDYSHMSQALCYGYFYCAKESVEKIAVQLRYCNIDTEEIKIIKNDYTFDELKTIFYDLIDIYLEWAKLRIEHYIAKRKTIDEILFPFDSYRHGQRNLLVAVYQTINNKKKLFVQAPTGIGKTISVLFPAIKALNSNNNSKICYLTAKSSTKQMAEDTIMKLQDRGLKLRTTVITAKEKICCNDSFNCDAEVCPYAKDYYSKLNKVLLNAIKGEFMYNREYIEKIAKEYIVCPFELSLELGYSSDVVICDYNYYFDPRVAFKREDFQDNTNDILLIDEAHNLEDRTRNMYSCELIKEKFYEVYKEVKTVSHLDKSIVKAIKNINAEFVLLKKELENDNENKVLADSPESLLKTLRVFVTKTEKWMNEKKLYKNEKLEELYFESIFFIKLSELFDENFCYYLEKGSNNTLKNTFKIKIFLINTSEILKVILKNAYSAIFFSATLTPLKYYRQILGGDIKEDKLLMLDSPFVIDRLNLVVTGNLSMKYTIRDSNIDKICEYIHTVVNNKIGNYIVFFPSYAYLNKVSEVYHSLYDYNKDNQAFYINNSAPLQETEQLDILNKFYNQKNVILFTVVGGVFSEGINLPNDILIGAIVIGTGIPQISFERNLIKNFFDKKYNSGYDFAYKYPGFNKVLQSVGRVIRTEEDRGIALLIDSRLLQNTYLELFPNHWKHYKKIYNTEQLKKILDEFWL